MNCHNEGINSAKPHIRFSMPAPRITLIENCFEFQEQTFKQWN